ncbi:putative aldolase class 2 protein CC_1201 [Glandiceps talaboti]
MATRIGQVLGGLGVRASRVSPHHNKPSIVGGMWVKSKSTSTSERQSEQEAAQQNYDVRVDLAAVYRSFHNYNLHEGVCNHLTAKAPSRDGSGQQVMLVIPYGLHWKEVTASTLVGVDMETGEAVEGDGQPEVSAVEIHRAMHRARPDIKASFHVHAPYTTALGILKDPEVLMSHQNVVQFYNEIAYDTGFDGYGTSEEEGNRLASVLGNKSVLMMGNHGVLCVADHIAKAFDRVYYLERCAMFQVLAMSTGKEIKILSKDLIERMKQDLDNIQMMYQLAHFNSMKHILLKEEPDYRT